jgi:hypothetical protein
LKEYLIALSLTNLCFYNIILSFFYKNKFYLKILPGTNQLLALILSELLIATLFWLAWRLVKKINNRYLIIFAKFVVCLLTLIFIYDLARDYKSFFNIKMFRISLFILLIILIIRKKTTKIITSFLLIMAPFVGIIFFQSLQGIIIDQTKKTPPPIKQPLFSTQNKPRVLWLIFDGFDYRIAFVDKPNQLELPAFDRLLQQSFVAHNAYPPGNSTRNSIPALIDGKLITKADIGDYNKLSITYQGSNESINWGSQPNLFSKAQELNVNTALVGEYLPYPHFIGKYLAYCDWYQFYPQYTSSGSVLANMRQQIKMLLIGPARHYVQRKEAYFGVQNQTKKLVSNPDYNLVMIHNPIPHAPYFYHQPWWDYGSQEGYLNALKLVDRSLAEIREIMEKQGTWDKTNIIVSADHGNPSFDGKFDQRVPFILKLAHQKEPVVYEPGFNTIITQELILAIFRRDVVSSDDLVKFLRQKGEMIEPAIVSD